MKDINGYLFAYGTLLQKGNKVADYLYKNSSFYGKGKVSGKLYDIGSYPALVLQPGSDHFVHGNIYALINPEATLIILDDYEGINKGNTRPNEYTRKLTPVVIGDKTQHCWIYEYNLPVYRFKQIISGDYLAYKALTD